MLNTPPTFAWYIAGLVFDWIAEQGGVAAIAEVNKRKAAKLYAAIDQSCLYANPVQPQFRSRMNVPFTLARPELDPVFLAEARAVVQQADRAADVARALAEGATGQLRMAHLRAMFSGPPELVVREYERRFPGVELTADSGTTASNVERLRDGELDVAFVLTPVESAADLGCVEIATEPIVVALPSGHPLTRRRRVGREELADVPLVFFPRHYSPGYYDRVLSQVYGSPTAANIVRTEPEERGLLGVAEGSGVGLAMAERAATFRYPGVVYRQFADPEPTAALGVAFRQPPSLVARHFIDVAREVAYKPTTTSPPPIR